MNKIERSLKILITLASFVGVLAYLLTADRIIESISYFTMQSNIVVFLVFGYATVINHQQPLGKTWYFFRGMATVSILITMLVYHIALRPIIIEYGIHYDVFTPRDVLVHYVTPLLVLSHWLVSHQKYYSKKMPYFWLSYPLFYIIYVGVYTSLGGYYTVGARIDKVPYFFFDVAQYGIGRILLWNGIILLIFIGVGYILIGIHHVTIADDRRRNN